MDNFKKELNDVCKIKNPRQFCSSISLKRPYLHIFCDASELAYGCCAYLSCEENGRYSSSLVCSKAKVDPLKVLSIPKLELCSAVLAAELALKLLSELQILLNSIHFWTDSKVVLAWISQSPHHWKTFVANRVAKIQDCSSVSDWNYVSSDQNPADVISRGCSPARLINNDLYWHGPEWLCQQHTSWPSMLEEEISEVPEAKIQPVVLLADQAPKFKDIYSRFSNFHRLIRVISRILRWKGKNFEGQSLSSPLTDIELAQTETKIIKLIQEEAFSQEMKKLSSGKQLDSRSSLLRLRPFLDKDGILRVGGRIDNASATYNQRHPIILPKKHHVTDLIIRQIHYRNLHAGPRTLLYIIREQFWPLQSLRTVNTVLSKCMNCFKANLNQRLN